MPIYDKPVKLLMREFAEQNLQPGQVFSQDDAVKWFADHYPKIRPTTVGLHVRGMSANATTQRKHNPHIQPGNGWDLFFQIGRGQYRLYDPTRDPAPSYFGKAEPEADDGESGADDDMPEGSREFRFESHLRDYLSQNLSALEPGLKLFEEDEVTGVEYPAGRSSIDILATDAKGDLVVIELKVSRGPDRTIGQVLRYMGWVAANLAEGKKVRGIIVAGAMSGDLKLAASRMPDVKLVEYEISFRLKPTT